MRFADVLRIALTALLQQKVRTLLTLTGVVVGTFALAVSLSLSRGFEAEVMRQVGRGDHLRQIMVWPNSEVKETEVPAVAGPMTEAKRERLHKATLRRYNQRARRSQRRTVQLTPDRVRALAELDHVEAVEPIIQERFRVKLDYRPAEAQNVLGVGVTSDEEQYRHRLVAGSYLPSDDGRFVLVNEYLLYLWGITSEEEVNQVIGKTLHLEYRPATRPATTPLDVLATGLFGLSPEESEVLGKALKRLPELQDQLGLSPEELALLTRLLDRLPLGTASAGEVLPRLQRLRAQLGAVLAAAPCGPFHVLPLLLLNEPVYAADFVITGVLRELIDEDEAIGVTVSGLSRNADVFLPANTARDIFMRAPRNRETGYDAVLLTVDREENVKEVARKVKVMGFREFSLTLWMQRLRTSVKLSTYVTSFLAFVALIVACIGITNTMVMSVLERRHEIGVMKAVGARDGHIQLIFLLEGALIGGIGGALGILCSWLASLPGDALAHHLLMEQNDIPLKGTLFVFPLWLTLGIPLFACLVTTLAAVYPARRASRVNPITALRQE